MVGRVTGSRWVAALLFSTVVTAGCGPTWSGCEGEVSYEGEPMAAGSIRFFPIEGTSGIGGSARVEGGRYVIPPGRKFAAGNYLVSVTAARPTGRTVQPEPGHEPEGPVSETEQYIPERFNTNSEIRVILERGLNRHDFHLAPR